MLKHVKMHSAKQPNTKKHTYMGSQAIQGKLWGHNPKDWAAIQEATGKPGYDFVLKTLTPTTVTKLLDVGCGSGYFCNLAQATGANVTGMDASDAMIEEAKLRAPSIKFLTGDLEELPFEDDSFDVVCGFNSFQYAASTKNALAEAKRVLKPGGKLAAMIWGNKEDCESSSFLAALGSLLPPPPPGAAGPFALTENHLLESILQEVGFSILENQDIVSVWDYADADTALKGLLSTGVTAKAVEYSGWEKVRQIVSASMQQFIQPNSHVVYNNKFRVVIAEKP